MCSHLLSELYSFSALNLDWFICMNWDSPWYLFLDISNWYHHIWCILYTTNVINGHAIHMLPESVGVACSPNLSVSLEGMACEPVLDLSATSDEAMSIICTVVDKTIFNFWGKLMYMSYTTDPPGGSVGHPVSALAIICLWVLLTWLTSAYGCPKPFAGIEEHLPWNHGCRKGDGFVTKRKLWDLV